MESSVQIACREDYKDIEQYVHGHRDGFVFHHPGWFRALEKENGQTVQCLIYRDDEGKISGLLPLLVTEGLPFGIGKSAGCRRLASLPRTPFCGPLADSKQITDILIARAIQLRENKSVNLLQYKSLDDSLASDTLPVQRVVWRKTYEKLFPAPDQPLTFGNARNHARIGNAVRKAENNGITVDDTSDRNDLSVWHRIYVETMQRHLLPSRSLRFFYALWDQFAADNHLKLIVARRNGRIIAGSLFLLFNRRAFYAFNGSVYQVRSLRANDAIQWYFQHYAHEHGFASLDLGEVADGNKGLHDFKKKWGVEMRSIYHYYNPSAGEHFDVHSETGVSRRCIQLLWQKVPVPIAARIGELVYRYL